MRAYINGKPFDFNEELTILQAARRVGAYIPTLCAFQPLNHTPGTCGVCLVDVERADGEKLSITSCKNRLEDGMKVNTSSPYVRKIQREQVELLFADHEQDCVTCPRYGNCELLMLARSLGVHQAAYTGKFTAKRRLDLSDKALRLDANKCIRCFRCVEVCKQVQHCNALKIDGIGAESGVALCGADRWIDSDRCVRCGQCTLVCPTGALAEIDQIDEALEYLENPNVISVVQFAPAVRATLGEAFGMPAGTNVEGKLITAIKKLGADYVLDTNFAADVTIMEEGTELLERLKDKTQKGPMFTSCCPAWVNWVEQHRPSFIPHLSTTRSPQGIMSSLAKNWLPEKIDANPVRIKVISIMPCTAKKVEAARPQLGDGSLRDTDVVLTVREFSRLLKGRGIDLNDLEESKFDTPFMSEGTGAAVIFGRSGGVAEAALRTLYALCNGHELSGGVPWHRSEHPNMDREVEVELNGIGKVKVGVLYGLANAEAIVKEVEEGKCDYDFIEVMSCPGGCVNGGGTPRVMGNYFNRNVPRTRTLDNCDRMLEIRQSHNNPMVKAVYDEFLGTPNSRRAHRLLHTEYNDRSKAHDEPDIRAIWKKIQLA